MADDFGPQDRLVAALAYTDDTEFTVLGPPSRCERLAWAIYSTYGPQGANMLFADFHKWSFGTFSLWCGVYSSPLVGLMWLGENKRLKAILGIASALVDDMTHKKFKDFLGYLNYIREIRHDHIYTLKYLWYMVSGENAKGDFDMIKLDSKARGKLKYIRKVITNCPGTSHSIFFHQKVPRSPHQVEWIVGTDSHLEWIDGVWTCGCGGVIHNVCWRWNVDPKWRHVCTIPLGEFLAMASGIFIERKIIPEALCIVSEVDASATPTILLSSADNMRLAIAHEELMETEEWIDMSKVQYTRQVWGDGNGAPDACSRNQLQRLTSIICGLGFKEITWLPLPTAFMEYMERVFQRIELAGLPPPSTAKPSSALAKHNFAKLRIKGSGPKGSAPMSPPSGEQVVMPSHPPPDFTP